jgi:hypothetical protein
MRYGCALWLAAALCFPASRLAAGEAAPPKAPEPPKAGTDHPTPKGMRFSWQEHKRPWYQHVLWYLPSRGADLLDAIGIEFGTTFSSQGAHPGVHANLHATRFMQLGIGRVYGTWAGMMGRYPVVVEQDLDEKAIGWWWRYSVGRKTLHGATPKNLEISQDEVLREYHPEVDPLGIGGTFFFGVAGVSLELKPHELLDFIAGLLTIDSRGDDY